MEQLSDATLGVHHSTRVVGVAYVDLVITFVNERGWFWRLWTLFFFFGLSYLLFGLEGFSDQASETCLAVLGHYGSSSGRY